MIKYEDHWHFQDLHRLLYDLAALPEYVIMRNDGKNVTEEFALDFNDRLEFIKSNYLESVNLQLFKAAFEIDSILEGASLNGPQYSDYIWTNEGFIDSKTWQDARSIARIYINEIISRDP